ncbi:hypothetical protein [Achromobacter insuavis]|uniref:hypothetical protein n=1 Tax=Achromobacter insuavis TaxID=1287735 RepID=UPI000AC0F7EF|nr:hypothetical protein [Achromobacter insuavis]
MPHRPSDPGIPTLTQRAEPTLSPSAPLPEAPLLTEVAQDDAPAFADDAFPLLTDVAQDDVPLLTETADAVAVPPSVAAAVSGTQEDAIPPLEAVAPAAPDASPQASVLAARLQAEVEQVMRQALADAIEQIQARMDEELPRIVARVLQDVRPG